MVITGSLSVGADFGEAAVVSDTALVVEGLIVGLIVGADVFGFEVGDPACVVIVPGAGIVGSSISGATVSGAAVAGEDVTGASITGADVIGAPVSDTHSVFTLLKYPLYIFLPFAILQAC